MNIGLTQRVLYHNNIAYDSIEHNWFNHLTGHTLFFVSNIPTQDFKEIAKSIDLLIITGGDDSIKRRVTETKLASEMLKQNKPVLGVCHGCFFLADLLGSTISEIDNHHNTEHTILYNNEEILVNSYHTLNIKKLHSTATPLATDMDGNVEAWIDGNLAGVVWHPERSEDFWLPIEINNLIKV